MDFSYEQKLQSQGYQAICGLDEAGRGCLAGPLVAAAVVFDSEQLDELSEVNDSKLLTDKKRQVLCEIILRRAKTWAIGAASAQEIDQHGLSFANKIAMKRAWKHLAIKPDFILSDYLARLSFETPFRLVPHGDRLILSIGAASIIAKVFRDRMMLAFDRKYPGFGFEKHKGYGTVLHRQKLKELGPCLIHRKTFEWVKEKLL